MDGDSGLDHSADEVDLPSFTEQNILEQRVEEEEEEDDEDDEDEVDLGNQSQEDEDDEEEEEKKEDEDREIPPPLESTKKARQDKIDFDQLEEEILGDELVEPDQITDTEEDDLELTEKSFSKRKTSDLITNMLSQMVIEPESRDIGRR